MINTDDIRQVCLDKIKDGEYRSQRYAAKVIRRRNLIKGREISERSVLHWLSGNRESSMKTILCILYGLKIGFFLMPQGDQD